MSRSAIEWTDDTWNPVRGCSRVSEGCRHCYAEQQAARIVRMGKGKPTPYDGLVKMVGDEARWTGKVVLDSKKLADPLRWRKPRRIFVNSMSDLFHESLTNEQIAAVFGVIAACPQHTFQVLTKRAKRMRGWFEWLESDNEAAAEEWSGRECGVSIHDARRDCLLETLDETATAALAGSFDVCHLGITINASRAWPLPNVWIGVSVENRDALHRLDDLCACPAAVRMISFEPLLEDLGTVDLTGMGWAIAGCESGPGARYCPTSALRSLRDQCAAAGVPYFLKQAVHSPITYGVGDVRLTSLEEITAGDGSKRKPGGVIGAPYLDGHQHLEFPCPT